MDCTTRRLIEELKADPNLSRDFRDALAEPKPAPGPVALGDWRGWKLSLSGYMDGSGRVFVTATKGCEAHSFDPNSKDNHLAGKSPEMVNALKEAYRRAVYARLPGAVWPEGWEWAKDEIPEHWLERGSGPDKVWLGWITHNNEACAWYPDYSPCCLAWKGETLRRAALLSLCEAKPAPVDVAEQLRAAGFIVHNVAPYNHLSGAPPTVIPCADGSFQVAFNCANKDRAVAALDAASGKWQKAWVWAGEQVETLQGMLQEQGDLLATVTRARDDNAAEVKRLKGEIAVVYAIFNGPWCDWAEKMRQWSERNKAT